MERYQSATDVVQSENPKYPVFCQRPFAAERAANWFCTHFPGKSFYAVKANPAPWLVAALRAGGIDHFDVASIKEARLVRELAPAGTIGFMHPVKSAEAIAEAYFDLGVRIFALDSQTELEKIIRATSGARDLTLCVRLHVSSGLSKIPLTLKFGVWGGEAAVLMRSTRQVAAHLGVCFHVGSQTMAPSVFTAALETVQRAIVRSGVIVDVLDVGGGFPSVYPGMAPPPLESFVQVIGRGFETTMLVAENCELWCEPGRSLSAEASSLIVRVEHRKGDVLHINDGVFGALFDAGPLGWLYPVRQLGTTEGGVSLAAYSFYGPTCDDFDVMWGPFMLPENIRPGDYIEVGMLGAYGATMRTDFNGFATHQDVEVADMPMFTQFGPRPRNSPPQVREENKIADRHSA